MGCPRSPAAPGGFGSSVRRWQWRRRGWRGGSWFLASLMPGLTITSGNVSRHGSHQGGPISATAGARLGQDPSLGSGDEWWEQNVPSRTCGMGRASAGPGPAARPEPPASLRARLPPSPGVWGSHGVWMGFSSHAGGVLGAKVCVPPLQHRDSGASPHHPGGSRSRSGSPPWWRQQLSRTLFWMFMGFQFTPGSEAAKLPSQGGVIPRMRPVSLMCRGAQPWPPSPCAAGGSFGSSACQGAPSSQHQKIWSK